MSVNNLASYICDTQSFVHGQLKKSFLQKIVEICQTIPPDQTLIEINLIRKLEHKRIKNLEKEC